MGFGLKIIPAVPNVVRCPKAWTKIMTMWSWQETQRGSTSLEPESLGLNTNSVIIDVTWGKLDAIF